MLQEPSFEPVVKIATSPGSAEGIDMKDSTEEILMPLGRAVSVLERIDKSVFHAVVSGTNGDREIQQTARHALLSIDVHLVSKGGKDVMVPILERVAKESSSEKKRRSLRLLVWLFQHPKHDACPTTFEELLRGSTKHIQLAILLVVARAMDGIGQPFSPCLSSDTLRLLLRLVKLMPAILSCIKQDEAKKTLHCHPRTRLASAAVDCTLRIAHLGSAANFACSTHGGEVPEALATGMSSAAYSGVLLEVLSVLIEWSAHRWPLRTAAIEAITMVLASEEHADTWHQLLASTLPNLFCKPQSADTPLCTHADRYSAALGSGAYQLSYLLNLCIFVELWYDRDAGNVAAHTKLAMDVVLREMQGDEAHQVCAAALFCWLVRVQGQQHASWKDTLVFGTLQAFLAPEAQHSSPRVADCVAYAVVETPTELLPILFEGVTQGHTVAVQALQILLGGIQRHVPGCRRAEAPILTYCIEALGTPYLQSPHLPRSLLYAVVAQAPPSFVVPKILCCIAQLCSPPCSPALEAVDLVAAAVVESTPLVSVPLILDCLRYGLGPKTIATKGKPPPRSPAEIGASSPNLDKTSSGVGEPNSKPAEDQVVSVVLEHLVRWLQACDPNTWRQLVVIAVRSVLQHSRDAVPLQFLRLISPQSEQNASSVLSIVEECLRTQPSLTLELIDSTSPESTFELQQLLFDRLAPLLVLRVMPATCFSGCGSALASQLLERVHCLHEFEEVRKLAAELCGSLDLADVLPVALRELRAILSYSIDLNSITQFKGLLLACCHCISRHGMEPIKWATEVGTVVFDALVFFQNDDPRGSEVEIEQSKVMLGCIDCLALVAHAELQHAKQQRGPILEGDMQAGMITAALACLLNDDAEAQETKGNSSYVCHMLAPPRIEPIRICAGNVLVQTIKMADPVLVLPLLRKITPHLACGAAKLSDQTLRASCIQILFVATYQCSAVNQSHEDAGELMRVCMAALDDEAEQVQIAALKLLGCCCCLKLKHETLTADRDLILQALAKVPSKSSVEVRDLIHKLGSMLAPLA